MIINKDNKLNECVSKDSSRSESMRSIHFDKEANKLVATNGKLMVWVTPVDVHEEDVAGDIPTEAWKLASSKKGYSRLVCNQEVVETGDQIFKRNHDKFPNWTQVVPKPSGEPVVTIGIDARLLLQVQKALGVDSVIMEIHLAEDPILIMKKGVDYSEEGAVIMPMRISKM